MKLISSSIALSLLEILQDRLPVAAFIVVISKGAMPLYSELYFSAESRYRGLQSQTYCQTNVATNILQKYFEVKSKQTQTRVVAVFWSIVSISRLLLVSNHFNPLISSRIHCVNLSGSFAISFLSLSSAIHRISNTSPSTSFTSALNPSSL